MREGCNVVCKMKRGRRRTRSRRRRRDAWETKVIFLLLASLSGEWTFNRSPSEVTKIMILAWGMVGRRAAYLTNAPRITEPLHVLISEIRFHK